MRDSGAPEVSRIRTRTLVPLEHSETKLVTLMQTNVMTVLPVTTVLGELKPSPELPRCRASLALTTRTRAWVTNSTAESVPDRSFVLRLRRRPSMILAMKVNTCFYKLF